MCSYYNLVFISCLVYVSLLKEVRDRKSGV